MDELAALDPLKDTGFSRPSRRRRRLPAPSSWFRLALPVAVMGGVALGWTIWNARNLGSERALYAAAREKNDVASYEAYLARGGMRAEVTEVLLPRAELETARRIGTVAAIEEFIQRRPNNKIQDEAMAALKTALLAELEAAKKKGGVMALRAVPRKHPRHALIQTELSAAIRDAYQHAYRAYLKQAPAADEKTASFVKRLLAYAEKNGPKVQIVYVDRLPQTYELADLSVRQSTYFAGTISTPSQYFDEAHVRAREVRAGQELVRELQRVFPPEILEFELGPRLKEPRDGDRAAKLPTLFIEHTTGLSGTYVSSSPRGVFVGISMMFQSRFEIPGDDQPLTLKHAAWHPPKLEPKETDKTPSVVYDNAALEAFRAYNQKLIGKLLAKS
jgi:hypothetical protein